MPTKYGCSSIACLTTYRPRIKAKVSAFACVFCKYLLSLHRLPVSDNKRLCSTLGCGKETENRLLVQICEAEQVSDFERILNSNAILCERPHAHVWRGCERLASTASVLPRPRSAYSLRAVSEAYHQLFRQHEESLQPLIQQYRQAIADEPQPCPHSILQEDWFENLQNLSEFYEDDQSLHEEIETITDKIVVEQVKASESSPTSGRGNFKVNLTDLIGLRVHGEGFSPISTQDGISPDAEKGEHEDKEWLGESMSANPGFEAVSQNEANSVESLTENLESCKISTNENIPTITFSNCCDGRVRTDSPDNNEVVIHLSVPAIGSADESRPPM
ncbi:hypothetical protein NE865_05370 [Phthorimaea operculella]|nr:hypothetical protein NE865_05370 [Phthorimaea operculella]